MNIIRMTRQDFEVFSEDKEQERRRPYNYNGLRKEQEVRKENEV